MLATTPEKCAMFPAFASAIYKPLLLPIGAATVERSFSTMNGIPLNSERCRLLSRHTCQLVQMPVEGPCVPDLREAKVELAVFNEFLEKTYRMWLAKPRRGLQ